jgi:hypothetical protein
MEEKFNWLFGVEIKVSVFLFMVFEKHKKRLAKTNLSTNPTVVRMAIPTARGGQTGGLQKLHQQGHAR